MRPLRAPQLVEQPFHLEVLALEHSMAFMVGLLVFTSPRSASPRVAIR